MPLFAYVWLPALAGALRWISSSPTLWSCTARPAGAGLVAKLVNLDCTGAIEVLKRSLCEFDLFA